MYYGSKISDNMTRTPEDFLICLNVPIGRTGIQEYLGQELGLEYGKCYEVIREENEVFSVAAMASFEGKPFTDEHPPDGVTPENAASCVKGTVREVRRGKGEQQDLLLADIVVYDRDVIRQIENGKREISCGYQCVYEQIAGNQYKQTGIIGNHVALVQQGRAGERVSIKDSKPNRRREKPMKQTKKSIWGKMVQAFAQDATPEEMEQAVDEMVKACGDEEAVPTPAPSQEAPKAPVTDEGEGNPMDERLAKLEAAVGQILQALQPKKEPDALDALEAELQQKTEPAADEGSVTVEPEEVNQPTADSAVLLNQINTLKPLVAQIKDPVQRKKTGDTLAAMLRQSKAAAPQAAGGSYAALCQTAMHNAAKGRQAADAILDDRELGRKIAKKYNPHYKEAK